MIDYEQIQMEYARSYADKTRIYFIEQYFSTFNAEVGRNSPFVLFPRQKEFIRSLTNNAASIAIKHRQAGITTVTSAWAAAQMTFAGEDAPETILCIGNKLDLSQQLITKIRDFLNQVPRWYWGDEYYSPDPKSNKNKKDIFVKNSKSELELFNGCKVYARSSGENAARGISAVSILIFDEAAFIENGLAVYSSAVAATASVPNRKIVMVSTPNGKDELYYNTYRQALSKENNYNAVEFKWFQDLRYNKNLKWYKKDKNSGEMTWQIEETDSEGNVHYDEEKWRNLEKDGWIPTSPWYEEMCRSFNNDPMRIAQELDVSFMGSANNVVAPEYIEMQSKLNVCDPLEDMKDPMTEDTWFWEPPIEGHRYILSCLPEGEMVRTQRGLVKVEDVKDDDKLVTREGKYAGIVRRMSRKVENEKIITIRPVNTVRKTSFTWNHPIWSSVNTKLKRYSKKKGGKRFWDFKFQKNNAEDLNVKDWLEIPNTYRLKVLTDEEICSHWNSYKDITRIDYAIECPLLNEDFWWYCGMWLAEGFVKITDISGQIFTAHNINEVEYIKRIEGIAKNIFNRKTTLTNNIEGNSSKIQFGCKQVANFLVDNFGKYADGKFIAEWIKFIPEKYKIKLIEGYIQGDGFIHRSKINCGFTSISLELLECVQDILLSLGIISNLKLHVKEGTINWFKGRKKPSICKNKYELTISLYDTQRLLKLMGIESDIKLINRRVISSMLFSEDLNKIYFRISEKDEKIYTGNVYNFWVDDDTHTYTCMNISVGNCDPSRGDAADRTAIEVIDMDGKDENGLPILTQSMEYLGRKLGDEVGALVYNYATLYNEAFVVVDATGGVGDAALLTLKQMGYKNIFYDDPTLKKYTATSSQEFMKDEHDKMPGFHMQGNRFPMLSLFAGMIRNNEFKVKSVRVINELDTWIFKGETGRMDHMSGAHDDALTCLAMGLFVMQYSFNKLEATKHKDAAILNAYIMNKNSTRFNENYNKSIDMRPKSGLPFYNNSTLNKYGSNVQGSYLWLFSGLM